MRLSGNSIVARRLGRGREARSRFVESHLAKAIAYQIRATRERQGLTQEHLADLCGMTQTALSRLESPSYGKHTISTLKRIASALDVGLVVRLARFSDLGGWVEDLSAEAIAIPSYSTEVEKELSGDSVARSESAAYQVRLDRKLEASDLSSQIAPRSEVTDNVVNIASYHPGGRVAPKRDPATVTEELVSFRTARTGGA